MMRGKAPTIADALRAYESMTPEEQSRRYRGLLKSYKQLEARVREDERATQWWKERTGILDGRCRELAALLNAALDEKKVLMDMVGDLEAEISEKRAGARRERWVPGRRRGRGLGKEGVEVEVEVKEKEKGMRTEGVNAMTQTGEREGETDLTVKALVQTLLNAQADAAIASGKGTACGCESTKAPKAPPPQDNGHRRVTEEKEDPLGAMLSRRKARRRSRSRSGSLEERGGIPISADRISLASTSKTASTTNDTDTNSRGGSRASGVPIGATLQMTDEPPEVLKERRARKQALKMKLKATREMVDGIRKENGVLEGLLLGEGERRAGKANRAEYISSLTTQGQ